MTTAKLPLVMIVDDDPSHLQLYGWIIERGGFGVHPVLATGNVASLPLVDADLAVLDYKLGPLRSPDVARRWLDQCPNRPIIVLSDGPWLPDEFAGITKSFIRKGEPQQLIDTIASLLKLT